ncbi:MAG: neutral/alkaline non-lysosomal ceramidase N-terminal domain-containing protein [Armatimonadetes bacterium]|nr:neutral/alkaline non-lysosomal ceramidase N-terminal domain-containing protein [Armatimonadota bacterium]
MATWLAGVSEVVITPPVGMELTGFGDRSSGATGIHDDLYARALVLEAGGRRAAVVTTDLLGLDAPLVQQIRALVAEQCGIPPERLLLNASHTHSGPGTIPLRGLGMADPAYLDVLVRHIAGAARIATDRLAPATLRFGTAPVQVGMNRRQKRPDGRMVIGANPDGPTDPTVYVLRVESDACEPVALLFSYAAHPLALGGDNLLLTADYPGEAVSVLREIASRRGGAPIALFAQGCCGNINSYPRGTFEDARRLGTLLGAAAAIAAESAEPVEGGLIRSAQETLLLPFLPPPPEPEVDALLGSARGQLARMAAAKAPPSARRMQQALVDWASDTLRAIREPDRFRHQPFEIQALLLGDVAFVALPGEVFIEYALNIRARSPFARTVALGYTNGCTGYVPTAAAYPDGGYEVAHAYRYYGTLMIAPESERLILDAVQRLLQGLAASSEGERTQQPARCPNGG